MSTDGSVEIPDENPPPTSPSAFSSPSSTHALLSGDDSEAAQPGPRTPPQSKTRDEVVKVVNRTPTQLKVSTHRVAPKDRPFNFMIQQEMNHRCHEVKYKTFMSFAKVSALEDKIPRSFKKALKKNKVSKFDGLVNCTDETQMYAHLCKGFNSTLQAAKNHSPAGQSYLFKDTSSFPETADDDSKPDLAMYPDTVQASEAFLHNIDKKSASKSKARTAWGWMTAAVEVKFAESRSAFSFGDNQELLRSTDEGKEALAQVSKYAAQILLRQHRTSVFLVYVCNTKARLTRWDRTGCTVSTPIDLKIEPEKLLYFIYRLGRMSPAELGYDETAVLATPDEVEMLRQMPHVNKYALDRAKEILEPKTTKFYPIYKITRDNADGTSGRVFFVGKHSVATYSITGRATKGYIAFIPKTDEKSKSRLGFMKDYWRPDSLRIISELEIYKELRAANVQHVATVAAGGDLKGQTTRTHEFLRDRPYAPTERLHCYILFNELARPLEDYENSEALVTIVYHALLAHKDAWLLAKILHRDISCSNIMFVVDQDKETETVTDLYGILNDWDLCKHAHELVLEQTQSGRSGTWAFMSGVSLQYPLKPYRLSDDLEAFIHIMTFCSLRFHFHDSTDESLYEIHKSGKALEDAQLRRINSYNKPLSRYVADYYYEYNAGRPNTRRTKDWGGTYKTKYAKSGFLFWSFADVSEPLEVLVEKLHTMLKTHYETIDFQALEARYSTSGGGRTMTLSTIDEGDSNGSEKTTKENGALSTDPFTKKPNPGNDLNSHLQIMSIFESAISDFRNVRTQGLSRNDKTPDQFLGLREWYDDPPKGPSGSHRSATILRSASRASAGVENAQDATSHGVQTGVRRKSDTDDIDTRPKKVSRTSEQQAVGEPAESEVVEDDRDSGDSAGESDVSATSSDSDDTSDEYESEEEM